MITFLIVWYIIICLITSILVVHAAVNLTTSRPDKLKFKLFLYSFITILIITPIIALLIDTNIVLRELSDR